MPRQPNGFTLIELLVVISILAVLMSMLFPAITGIRNSVNKSRALGDLDLVAIAMSQYRTEDGRKRFPSTNVAGTFDGKLTSSVLGVLSSRYPWDGYLQHLDSDGNWIDPWERPYYFRAGGPLSRPFVGFTDWNPRGDATFPYLWSLGVPEGTDDEDAMTSSTGRPATATPAWVYRAAGK